MNKLYKKEVIIASKKKCETSEEEISQRKF